MKRDLGLIWLSSIFIIDILFGLEVALSYNIPVLLYHKFETPCTPSTNISLENFKAQMAYLRAHNYQVIPLRLLVNALKNHISLPPKTVVITIDDGYKSVYEYAFPILNTYGYPFTVFLSTEAIEKGYPDYISWKEIKVMQRAGVDFQDHSYSHSHLAFIPDKMSEIQYRNWIKKDLKKSQHVFKTHLDYIPEYLAFPYGEYNQILIEEALKMGYKALFTQDPGVVSENTNLTLIPREPILGKEWSSLKHFSQVLNRLDLPLLEFHPALGLLKSNSPKEIKVKIKYPKRYLPDSFRIYISELGWYKVSLDQHKATVCFKNIPTLTHKVNRIGIKAIEKKSKRTAINFWMIILP